MRRGGRVVVVGRRPVSAGLNGRLRRLETQDGEGPAVVPVAVYRAGEDHDAAIRRVFGARPLPPTIVLIPDNGRDAGWTACADSSGTKSHPTEQRP